MVVNGAGFLDVAGKFFPRIDVVHHQSPAFKFFAGLNQQVQPIHDKVELRNDGFLLEIIGQVLNIEIGQCRFSASLRVPDDAFPDAFRQFPFNGFGREKLRITHDVFFQTFGFLHIGQTISQHKSQTIFAQQRCGNSIGGRVRIFIGNEFRRMFDNRQVVIF